MVFEQRADQHVHSFFSDFQRFLDAMLDIWRCHVRICFPGGEIPFDPMPYGRCFSSVSIHESFHLFGRAALQGNFVESFSYILSVQLFALKTRGLDLGLSLVHLEMTGDDFSFDLGEQEIPVRGSDAVFTKS